MVQINKTISKTDGVIPAFYWADIIELEKKFTFEKPDFFGIDQNAVVRYSHIHTVRKICFNLEKEYGLALPWNKKELISEILIIRTDVIGDLICTIPLIRELKNNYPNAKISIVIRESNLALVENCPYIDRIALYKEGIREGNLYEQCKEIVVTKRNIQLFLQKEFAGVQFDAVFLPRELLSGRNMIDDFIFAFCSKAKYRIGHIIKNEEDKEITYQILKNCFSYIDIRNTPMHEVEYQLEMLKACGMEIGKTNLELWVKEEARKRIDQIICENGLDEKYILCAVGIVGRDQRQNWNVDNYKSLFKLFLNHHRIRYKFLLIGGSDAVLAAKNVGNLENVIDLTGKLQLSETLAVIQKSHIYVGSNTGLLHIASAFSKPAVVLNYSFPSKEKTFYSVPIRWGAYETRKIELLPPGGIDGCKGVCSKMYSHCINQIVPEEVEEAILKLNRE